MEAESNSLVCSSEVKNADVIKLVDEAVVSIFTRLNSKQLQEKEGVYLYFNLYCGIQCIRPFLCFVLSIYLADNGSITVWKLKNV